MRSELLRLATMAAVAMNTGQAQSHIRQDDSDFEIEDSSDPESPCQAGDFENEPSKYPRKAKSSHKQNARASTRKKKRRR